MKKPAVNVPERDEMVRSAASSEDCRRGRKPIKEATSMRFSTSGASALLLRPPWISQAVGSVSTANQAAQNTSLLRCAAEGKVLLRLRRLYGPPPTVIRRKRNPRPTGKQPPGAGMPRGVPDRKDTCHGYGQASLSKPLKTMLAVFRITIQADLPARLHLGTRCRELRQSHYPSQGDAGSP